MSYTMVLSSKSITSFNTNSNGYYENDTNYYGETNTTALINTSSTSVNFENNGIILGGGGAGSTGSTGNNSSGLSGGAAFSNTGVINTFINNGSLLGGGGGGANGGGNGGAGGGGGGGGSYYGTSGQNGYGGVGGSLINTNTNGFVGVLYGQRGAGGGGGGGPGGNGGNGTYTEVNPSVYGISGGGGGGIYSGQGGENSLGDTFYDGGNATSYVGGTGGVGSIGIAGNASSGSGGGGYGAGVGGNGIPKTGDPSFNGGSGGGGGGGGAGGYYGSGSTLVSGGNGGYGLSNSSSITNLNNLQGGNEYTYGPLFFSGELPTNYNIIINSSSNYGQLWCTGYNIANLTGTMNFNIDVSNSNPYLASTTLQSVLILPTTTTYLTSPAINVTNYSGPYTWSLTQSSITINSVSFYSYDLNISTTFDSSKGSYTANSLYVNNPGTITYTNSTLNPKAGNTFVLVDSNGNYVSDELTTSSNQTSLTFTNVILDTLGTNTLMIYNVEYDTEVVGDIVVNVLAQDEELGMVTTNPSPLLQNNAGTLTYTNVSINPIVNNSYVLKNIYGSYVSNILYVTTTGLSSFNFLNVIIPFGGINNLTIYNITTRKTIVYNIEIGVSTVCFKEGTQILCYINKREVYVPIEKIKEDDFVKVYNGNYSYKKAKFIIKSQLMNSASTTINKLYKLSKDKHHNLIDDLYVTGGHALLHDSLSEDELEKMEALANHYNNYNVVVENENLTDEEIENMSQLIKYYRDYKITLFNKYKLIAYYNLDFEEVNDNALFNIYHLVIENDNKYGSYGVFANGILAETTDEAGLIRFPGYEKINCKKVIPEVVEPETILDKLAKKLNKKIIKETDKFLEEEETKETRVRRTLKRNKITNKNITLRK